MKNIEYEILGSQIIDRVLKLIEIKGVTKRHVLLECDLAETSFANWQVRKTTPTVDAVIKFAEYFNVSADYLITGQNFISPILSNQEKQVLEKFKKLDDKQKQVAIDYLDLQLKYASKAIDKNKQA